MQSTESEGRDSNTLKLLVVGLVIFLTVGVSIASEALSRFGLEDNYVVLFSVAFVLAILLLSRNLIMIGLVLFGVAAVNLPETMLASLHLDQDFLLALVCALILLPTVYKLIFR